MNTFIPIIEELNKTFNKSIPRISSIRTNSISQYRLNLNIKLYLKHKKLLTLEANNMIVNDESS